MESLDLLKSIASSASYLIVVSVLFVGDRWESKNIRSILLIGYFVAMFLIDVIFTMFEMEVYANYIFLVITSIFIYVGMVKISGKAKGFCFINSLGFALAIFAAFQWVVVFSGSIAFILFAHGMAYDGLVASSIYVLALCVAHIGMAYLLRKYSHRIFRLDISNKIALIDILAKVFFIGFFNLFFPRYFEILGMSNYAALSLVLLVIVAIFVVYREYSIALESKLAVSKSNLVNVLQWAKQVNGRYRELIFKKAEKDGESEINGIDNSVIQALMRELIVVSEQMGIDLDITVVNPVSENININTYDLFTIINNFIDSAIFEASNQQKKSIEVEIDGGSVQSVQSGGTFGNCGLWLMIKTHIGYDSNDKGLKMPRSKIQKDFVVGHVQKHSNISISIFLDDGFVQVLDVGQA